MPVEIEPIDILAESRGDLAFTLFRVLQETLHNVEKHARASTVDVSLRAEEERIVLSVRDDGEGFDPESLEDGGGLGLTSMRERVETVGGEISIRSQVREGPTSEPSSRSRGRTVDRG